MQVALRVLIAVSERRDPDSEDVEELKRIAPIYANLPHDELTCKVMNAMGTEVVKQNAYWVCRPTESVGVS